MTFMVCCEDCRRRTELYYSRRADAYLCDDCIGGAVEEIELEEEEA